MSHFDKKTKDKLQFHSVEVPDDMWDRIEAGLPKNKRKKRYLPGYITSALILFLMLGIASFYIINNNSFENPTQGIIKDNSNTNEFSEIKEKLNTHFLTSHKEEFKALTQQFQTKSNSNSTIQKNQSLSSQKNNYTSQLSLLPLKTKLKKTTYKNKNNYKFEPIVENNSRQLNQIETELIINSNQDLAQINFLEGKPTSKLISNQVSNSYFKKTKEPDECLRLNKVKIKAFADLYYSNDLPIRRIESKSENFNLYASQREETEKVQYSFSAGLRIGMGITNKINFMTGAQYSQINEKFEYTDPESSQTKVITTKFYIKDINGNIVDSTSSEETVVIPGTLSYKINNVFRAIDIPFILGYQIYDSKKFNLYANLGAYANMSFRQKGMVLNPNNSTTLNLANPQNNIYISDLGFSTYLGLAMTYNIDTKLSILVEPTMRNHLKSITLKDHPTSHSYTILGVSTGVRMIF